VPALCLIGFVGDAEWPGPTKSGGAATESAYLGFTDMLAPQFQARFVTVRVQVLGRLHDYPIDAR
jgi:hypothetical protein